MPLFCPFWFLLGLEQLVFFRLEQKENEDSHMFKSHLLHLFYVRRVYQGTPKPSKIKGLRVPLFFVQLDIMRIFAPFLPHKKEACPNRTSLEELVYRKSFRHSFLTIFLIIPKPIKILFIIFIGIACDSIFERQSLLTGFSIFVWSGK